MATRMQQRRGTASQWTQADPILAAGEIGFESDTGQFKIGDGINHWDDLSYFKNLEDLGGSFDDFVELADLGQPNKAASLDSSGYVPVSQLGNIIGDAPALLNTLEEIASAIDDANGIVAAKIAVAIEEEREARDEEITNLASAIGNDISDAVGTHNSDTTNVHGIADTSLLATTSAAQGYVSTHNSETTNVHGISDTAALATKAGTETLTNKTISAADNTVTINLSDVVDVTASVSEVNILDGATVSTTELNYVDGVTSAIQTQLDDKAPLEDPTFTGTLTAADVEITGNLTIGGTTTTVNATDLEITDPLIYMSVGNWTTDVVDVGFLAATGEVGGTEGSHKHSGLIRDVSDSAKWKLLSNVQHPTSNIVDLTDAVYDTLKLGGVEFSDGVQTKQGVPSLTSIVSTTAGDGYSVVLTDRDKLIEVNPDGQPVTVTIPTNSSVAYPVGTSIDILQISSGEVTIAGAGGVTVNATPGLKLRTQWSSATLFKRAENTWVVYGDLSA